MLSNTVIDQSRARALAEAAEQCWQAIRTHDLQGFGRAVKASFEAQVAMFPLMVTPSALELIDQYGGQAIGWKVSGAGGGGYLILVAERPITHALRPSHGEHGRNPYLRMTGKQESQEFLRLVGAHVCHRAHRPQPANVAKRRAAVPARADSRSPAAAAGPRPLHPQTAGRRRCCPLQASLLHQAVAGEHLPIVVEPDLIEDSR
ncbi:MAG: hypothetical protein U0X20_09915 [Caldilineaceae bacterium]